MRNGCRIDYWRINSYGMKNAGTTLAKSNYTQLSELGSIHNLSFSSYLETGNKIIGLDGIKRSLLVWETTRATEKVYIIELDTIAAITVKKVYGSITPEELKHKEMEEFLQRVELQFEYKNKNQSMVLPFYDSETNALSDLQKLERNAKNWQLILSKMAALPTGKIIKKTNRLPWFNKKELL